MKRCVTLLLILVLTLTLLSGCGQNNNKEISTGEIGVIKETQFGGIYTELSVDEFNEKGFSYGDSVNVKFDNGKEYTDIPYFDGYYVRKGIKFACAYPGYPHVSICIAQGSSMWDEVGVDENSKMTVSLNEKAKYLQIQNALSMVYQNDRNQYTTDEEFANFRAMKGGNLTSNLIYRGASPVDNKYNRAPYVDSLIKNNNVNFIMDLADGATQLEKYAEGDLYSTSYFKDLLDDDKVDLLNLNFDYDSVNFATKVANSLVKMTQVSGPYYIHCQEGKDRTGFVCALILGLVGASTDEILDDYMKTYENYYGISKTDEEKYNILVEVKANEYLEYFSILSNSGLLYDSKSFTSRSNDYLNYFTANPQSEDLSESIYVEGCKTYLEKGGLTEEQINNIIEALTSKK